MNGNEKMYNITKQPMTMALIHHIISYFGDRNFTTISQTTQVCGDGTQLCNAIVY
jgi:hypothetical protein